MVSSMMVEVSRLSSLSESESSWKYWSSGVKRVDCRENLSRIVRVCNDVEKDPRVSFSGELVNGSVSSDGLWSLKLPSSARDGFGVGGERGSAGSGFREDVRGGSEALDS